MATIGLRICLSFAIGCVSLLGEAGAARAAVEISSKPTKNMSCSAGVCSPTARKAWLNEVDLVNMMANSDVRVTTGAGATVIEVAAAFSWVSPTTLTIDSERSIIVKREVTVAGPGGLTLTTNDGGTDGILAFENRGAVTFWDPSSGLEINGESYVLIRSIYQLARLIRANAAGKLALARDYDAGKDGAYNTPPISTAFTGIFEGLGHSIRNLTISSINTGSLGLFALVQGAVCDVRLRNASVTGSGVRSALGALAAENQGILFGDSSDGRIVGRWLANIGGLTGINRGTISNAASDASVIGENGDRKNRSEANAGGLVGENYGIIVQSHASGLVSAGRGGVAGGLVGYENDSGTVALSFATGTVAVTETCCGRGAYAGGLIGYGGHIAQSFATGAVSGGGGNREKDYPFVFVGGLVGWGYDITDSFATGSASSGSVSLIGGLAGEGGTIASSYSTGLVTTDGIESFVGGLLGNDIRSPDMNTTYWDLDTSGISDPSDGAGDIKNDPGITGLTDTQLKSGLPDGFDPAIWGQSANINSGYPYLLANPPPN
jgi:hypothetical protein